MYSLPPPPLLKNSQPRTKRLKTGGELIVIPSKTLNYMAARTDDKLLNGNELCWQAPCQSGSFFFLFFFHS